MVVLWLNACNGMIDWLCWKIGWMIVLQWFVLEWLNACCFAMIEWSNACCNEMIEWLSGCFTTIEWSNAYDWMVVLEGFNDWLNDCWKVQDGMIEWLFCKDWMINACCFE